MFKNHLSLCRFTTVIFFFVHNADAGEVSYQKKQYSCNESASFYHCNDGKKNIIFSDNLSFHLKKMETNQ